LKLDCEGAEYDIILNASQESLSRITKVVMELHPFEDHTFDEMHSFLKKSGFACDVSKDRHGLYMVYASREGK